ncbi:MAG TPA: hypothetical protein PLJ13_09280 [Cyclobacteriaceae bacterium]|nr:hypothetical protein [Cyclobacteriaceae bacterium]
MPKKFIYLLLALILPIGVFVFLRMFGKNEFTIPVYYEQGVSDLQPSCTFTYPVPYTIPDSIMQRIGWASDKLVVLLVADTSSVVDLGLKHLQEEFEANDFQIIYPSGENDSWDHWYACFFFLKRPWSAVLIDSEKRIRGYYAPNSREEVDRLIVEMKILLKKY